MRLNELRLSEDMKYIALYIALGFDETDEDIYVKDYDGFKITIDANNQKAIFGEALAIVNGTYLPLTTHKSFVVLECIDRLLNLEYRPSDIIIDLDNEFDIYLKRDYIKCFEWGTMEDNLIYNEKTLHFSPIGYTSRLVSGVIEYKTRNVSYHQDMIHDFGLFECKKSLGYINCYDKKDVVSDNKDFIIEQDRLIKYVGHDEEVIVPNGIREIGSCAFWDNQDIKEVELPESLINLGGDTFYNCKNLNRVNIPKNVIKMGNNPFAGCLDLKIKNYSNHFVLEEGVLYNGDKTRIIYYPINGKVKEFSIPNGVKYIGKHCFYMCDQLEKIIIPSSIRRMENNPFSGCTHLELENHSSNYIIKDKVIYNKFKTEVIGCLNSIGCDRLELLNVKSINRNSFWNCKGIKTIVLPKTLKRIGYNPFVGCSNIHFENYSSAYEVVDDVLYEKGMSKLVCYPAWKAVGHIDVDEHVNVLERGAFSGAREMKNINLHNVSQIGKSCFTNCNLLEKVYCPDYLFYIGEWAFAHCSSLKEISVYKECFVDNNATKNTDATIIRREKRSSYLIESDNLYTLKSLQKPYKGKIDSILIDPPYNSNIDYIGYKDGNYENGYDSFMRERIRLSYNLLSSKGFLVINIDEGGLDINLDICREIFGEKLVTVHRWKKKHEFFDANRVVLNPNKKQTDYEYIIICRKTESAILNKIMQPYIVEDTLKEKESIVPETFDCFGTTSSAKDEIKEIFGDRTYFSTPKPVKLMKELIRATTSKDSIIMDYFAGSGTVGQACIELNKEDSGSRKFILVSNNESNICKNVTNKRISKFTDDYVFIGE